MKKLLLGVVVVIGAWMAYSYLTTGRITLLPTASRSADEKKVDQLSNRLSQAQAQFRRANMAAGTSGVDSTAEAAEAMTEVQAVLDEVRALKPDLKTQAARKKADALEQRARTVLERSK